MNRICPKEETLSEYLAGILEENEKNDLEKHLAGCANCRQLIAESHHMTTKLDVRELAANITHWISKNKWGISSAISLLLSFVIPRYFLQFLTASTITGAKWIIDSRTTKMLFMIHEAWKKGDKEKTDRIFSSMK